MTSSDVFHIIGYVLQVLGWLIIARSLLSWFPNARGNSLVEIVYQITDPIMVPLQRIVPRIGMIDISPMIATLLLFGLAVVLKSAGT